MGIVKKTLFSLSMILFYANNAYATTETLVVADEATSSGKLVLLLVAVCLVALVLFLGYRMDKSEAQEKRKEQIIRKNNINDVPSKIYDSHIEKEEFEYFEKDEQEYMNQYKKISEETAVIPTMYPKLNEEIEEDSYEEVEEDIVNVYDNYQKENKKVKEDDETFGNSFDSTMVFDTLVKEETSTTEIKVEEKPKSTRKATTKKTSTKAPAKKVSTKVATKATDKKASTKVATKTTDKKASTKVATKTTAKKGTKTTKKEVEEKPKTTKKTATKKSTDKETTKATTKKGTKTTKKTESNKTEKTKKSTTKK